MKFIPFLLVILLPLVFSIDQISDDQAQPTATSDSKDSMLAETSQGETQETQYNNQTSSQTESTTAQNDAQPVEAAPQTAPQETQETAQTSSDNQEKSTTTVTKTPSPITDEAIKTTNPQTSTKTESAQQSSQVYVSGDDNSSCKGLCLNGGVCQNDACICPPGVSGTRCEVVFDANESQHQKKMDAVVTKYYYVMIGFLGLVAVMVLSEFCFKGGNENAPKEDIPIHNDQGQKYVDLDLEAGPAEDKNNVDVEANVAPVQEEQHYTEPEKVYEPEVVPVEEYAEPEVFPVEEEQNYVDPEAVAQEE